MKTVSETLFDYLKDVYQAALSVFRSLKTALPYLLNVNSGEFKKEVTEQYPDPVSSRLADELPARTRGLLFNDIEKCTGCGECERVCPVRCISLEKEPGPSPSKVWVSVFDIDFSRCIFCGLCVESCLPQSLVHTKEYEEAEFTLGAMVRSFGRGRITPEQRRKWAVLRREADQERSEP